MAKLSKRTAEQLRSHLSSLSPEQLIDILLHQAARDDDLRDRLLIAPRSEVRTLSISGRSSAR